MLIEEYFNKIKFEAFRLELRDIYNIEGEWDLFQKFKRGLSFPTDEVDSFCKVISEYANQKKEIVRVHVIPEKISDYLTFEIKIGYIPQAKAGSKIYILKKDIYDKIERSNIGANDFWLFDEKIVVELIYDNEGHFIEEQLVTNINDVKKYIALKNKVISQSTVLKKWLQKHPNLI